MWDIRSLYVIREHMSVSLETHMLCPFQCGRVSRQSQWEIIRVRLCLEGRAFMTGLEA